MHTTLPLGPAAGRPTPGGDAAGTRTWFEAATPLGPLRLCATLEGRHPVHAAAALGACGPLLDALDAWLGVDMDWQWIGTPASPLSTTTHTYAEWRAGDDSPLAPALLEWPWALLRMLKAPPAELAARLRWPHVGAVLVAAQWRIEAAQLAEIEVGGAVIVAPAFGPAWQGLLRAGYEPARPGIGAPLALTHPDAARVLAGVPALAAAPEIDEAPWCELRLEPLQTVSTDRLAGWAESAVGPVDPVATLWRCAGEREPARPLAAGRLMPWADGWALLVERTGLIHDEAVPARLV